LNLIEFILSATGIIKVEQSHGVMGVSLASVTAIAPNSKRHCLIREERSSNKAKILPLRQAFCLELTLSSKNTDP
jgi:hypothetical protein